MQIAILAGGLATRLGNITKDCPKSMVRIAGKPFLEYQLDFLKTQDVKDIVLCIGHLGEQIISYFGDGSKFGVDIKYSQENKPLGTAGALKNAETLLNDKFFTIYGDSFINVALSRVMAFFSLQDNVALMTVYKNHNRYDKSNTEIQGDLVTRYSKNDPTSKTVFIDYGVNLFRKSALNMVPENTFYSLEDLITPLVARRELLAFEVRERFYEIGSVQGLEEFKCLAGGGVK